MVFNTDCTIYCQHIHQEKAHKNGKEKNPALRIVAIVMAVLSLLSTMIISLIVGLPTGNA